MAELREAGDIEQDASVIMLLWNLSQDDKSKKGCKVPRFMRPGVVATKAVSIPSFFKKSAIFKIAPSPTTRLCFFFSRILVTLLIPN